MFSKKEKDNSLDLIKIAALLIHAAKIDEDYSGEEEEIIKKTLLEIGANNENLNEIITEGKKIEENSNQILDFTKKVKTMKDEYKFQIIEALWKIIYSNNQADIYETNLMRRLAGLMYIDNRIMANIKNKIKNLKSK